MESIRNIANAFQHFKLTRRYDYPALFILLQTSITLGKFAVVLIVFLAGFQYLNHWLNPERDLPMAAIKAQQPQTQVAPPLAPPALAQPARQSDDIASTTTISQAPELTLLLAADTTEASQPAKPAEIHYRARIQWTNIRRAPSAAAPIITSLSTDQQVRIVLQKGDWVQVQSDEVDTQNGYVLATLLEPVDPSLQ